MITSCMQGAPRHSSASPCAHRRRGHLRPNCLHCAERYFGVGFRAVRSPRRFLPLARPQDPSCRRCARSPPIFIDARSRLCRHLAARGANNRRSPTWEACRRARGSTTQTGRRACGCAPIATGSLLGVRRGCGDPGRSDPVLREARPVLKQGYGSTRRDVDPDLPRRGRCRRARRRRRGGRPPPNFYGAGLHDRPRATISARHAGARTARPAAEIVVLGPQQPAAGQAAGCGGGGARGWLRPRATCEDRSRRRGPSPPRTVEARCAVHLHGSQISSRGAAETFRNKRRGRDRSSRPQ